MQPIFDKFPGSNIHVVHVGSPSILLPESYEVVHLSHKDSLEYSFIALVATEYHIVGLNARRNAIRLVDPHSGMVIRSVQNIGSGPGEFESLKNLAYYDGYIFALDQFSQKVLRFTSMLDFVDEHVISGINVLSDIAYSAGELIYATRADSSTLYRMHAVDSNENQTLFHRYIINKGFQPAVYNSHLVSAHSGSIALLNVSLPLMFLYDRAAIDEAPEIIRFFGEGVEKADSLDSMAMPGGGFNLPPVEIPRSQFPSVGASPLFQEIKQYEDHIFIRQTHDRQLIHLTKRDTMIEYVGSYQILGSNGEPLEWLSMAIQYPWIYLGSNHEHQFFRLNMVEVFNK